MYSVTEYSFGTYRVAAAAAVLFLGCRSVVRLALNLLLLYIAGSLRLVLACTHSSYVCRRTLIMQGTHLSIDVPAPSIPVV